MTRTKTVLKETTIANSVVSLHYEICEKVDLQSVKKIQSFQIPARRNHAKDVSYPQMMFLIQRQTLEAITIIHLALQITTQITEVVRKAEQIS